MLRPLRDDALGATERRTGPRSTASARVFPTAKRLGYAESRWLVRLDV